MASDATDAEDYAYLHEHRSIDFTGHAISANTPQTRGPDAPGARYATGALCEACARW